MSKYAELDTALLAHIANGSDTMMKLEHSDALKAATTPFCVRDSRGNRKPHFRVIDGRLQALRKAEKIAYVAQKWHVLGASK